MTSTNIMNLVTKVSIMKIKCKDRANKGIAVVVHKCDSTCKGCEKQTLKALYRLLVKNRKINWTVACPIPVPIYFKKGK
jgi:hypothetical protein